MALKLLWTNLKQCNAIWVIKTWIIFQVFMHLNGFYLLANTNMEKSLVYICPQAEQNLMDHNEWQFMGSL